MIKMKSAKEFWDKEAENYDKEEEKDRFIYENAVERTKKYLKKTDTVMDYGCGTGLVANKIADCVRLVHGIDISSKMLEIAEQKSENSKIDNISYACTTLFDDNYMEGAFDVILAFYVLHLSEDIEKVMERLNKLLKPGGLMISATPCMKDTPFYGSLLFLGGKLGLIPKIKPYEPSKLENIMVETKFEIVETTCLRQKTREYFIVAKKL